MNLFDNDLLIDTLNSVANEITMNPDTDDEYCINGFITNGRFNQDASFYIHSTDRFNCGDIFQYDDNHYLITSDVTKRGIKYKGLAEYCNVDFPVYETKQELVGYDGLGKPIYKPVKVLVAHNYGVIKHQNMVDAGTVLIIATTDLVLTIRDNESNRETFTINYELEYEGTNYQVTERDFTKKGIIICRLTSVM